MTSWCPSRLDKKGGLRHNGKIKHSAVKTSLGRTLRDSHVSPDGTFWVQCVKRQLMLNVFLKYVSTCFIFCLFYFLLIIWLKYNHGVWSQTTRVQIQAPPPTSCVTSPLCFSVLLCETGTMAPSFQSCCEHYMGQHSTTRSSSPGGASTHGFPDLCKCQNPLGRHFKYRLLGPLSKTVIQSIGRGLVAADSLRTTT